MLSDAFMDKVDELTEIVYHKDICNKEDARLFIRALTGLIYDYKMIGMIYDFYTENVEYYKQNRIQFESSDELVRQVINFTAAFPNLKADIENIIVYKVNDDYYKIFRRLRYKGNNLGFSQYGPATGRSLENGCLNLSLLHLKRIEGQWKIDFEVNSDSEPWIREVCSVTA